jgi:hypothetical protein
MERMRKGQTGAEEEVFLLWDELRKRGMRDPKAAIFAAKKELGIEDRIAVIYMQRYTRCFGEIK